MQVKTRRFSWLIILGVLAFSACGPVYDEAAATIPVTTDSEEARALFLEGRKLADNVRATDAREYFEKAIAEDQTFAAAHLALANTATTAQEFFEGLKRAVANAANASEGERLTILAQDAGMRGDAAKQSEYLSSLVTAYPQDKRAHSLLANFHGGRQEYAKAIEHYKHAVEIDPAFATVYNNLGYTYRAVEDYDAAEGAFKKYIALIPDEPNPYDSYAELLMKMGRFEESIENYKKALEIQPKFVFSYAGIGNNQILMGKFEEARETFKHLYDGARNDGERRAALASKAASYVHEGNHAAAMVECEKLYALAEKTNDLMAMAGDTTLMGDIQLAAGRPANAAKNYSRSVELTERADVEDEVKEAARRNHLFYEARVALAQGKVEDAKAKTEQYRLQAEAKALPFEQRRVHQLLGMIAIESKDYDTAVSELEQAGKQNPRVLYQLVLAYRGHGDNEKAKELGNKTANFNGLHAAYPFVSS